MRITSHLFKTVRHHLLYLLALIFCIPQVVMAATSGTVQVLTASSNVVITNNGSDYIHENFLNGGLNTDIKVNIQTNATGKVKSWETWLNMGTESMAAQNWSADINSKWSKNYKFNERPQSVSKTVKVTSLSSFKGFALARCNIIASNLRQGGYSDQEIFSVNRSVVIGLRAQLDYDAFAGVGGVFGSLPETDNTKSWSELIKVTVVCGKSATPAFSGAKNMTTPTTVDGAWLTLVEKTSFSGTCKLDLNGNFKTSVPGTEVTFRYHDDKGNISDLKTETTGDDKFAFFTHTYDVSNNPDGAETGSIRMVGVSHQFESAPWNYDMNCSNVNSQIDVIQPPEVKVVLTQLEDYVTMSDNRTCPSKARFVGRISGNGHQFYGRAVIQVKQGQQSKYSTDYLANVSGNSWKIFGGYVVDLDWTTSTDSAATYTSAGFTGPTSKTLYARVKVYNKSMNLIQPITNLQPFEVKCNEGPQMMGIPLSKQAKTSNTVQVKQMGVEKKQKKTLGKTPTTSAAIKTSAKADLIVTTPGLIFAGGIHAWGSTVTVTHPLNQVNKGLGPQKNLCRFTQTAFRPFNKGNVATGQFTTIVYRNNQQAKSVNFLLQANSGIPVAAGWYKFDLLLAQGMNTVKVKLDTANSVSESNESNNIYTVKVNVKFSCRKPNIGGSSSVLHGKTTSQPARSVPGQRKIKCKAGQVAVKKNGTWQCKQSAKKIKH